MDSREIKFPTVRMGTNIDSFIQKLCSFLNLTHNETDNCMNNDKVSVTFKKTLNRFYRWNAVIKRKTNDGWKFTTTIECNGRTIADLMNFIEKLP